MVMSVSLRVRLSPFYLLNACTYFFYKTHDNYSKPSPRDTDDIRKVNRSKVKVKVSQPYGKFVNSSAPGPLKGFHPTLT